MQGGRTVSAAVHGRAPGHQGGAGGGFPTECGGARDSAPPRHRARHLLPNATRAFQASRPDEDTECQGCSVPRLHATIRQATVLAPPQKGMPSFGFFIACGAPHIFLRNASTNSSHKCGTVFFRHSYHSWVVAIEGWKPNIPVPKVTIVNCHWN